MESSIPSFVLNWNAFCWVQEWHMMISQSWVVYSFIPINKILQTEHFTISIHHILCELLGKGHLHLISLTHKIWPELPLIPLECSPSFPGIHLIFRHTFPAFVVLSYLKKIIFSRLAIISHDSSKTEEKIYKRENDFLKFLWADLAKTLGLHFLGRLN